MLQMRSKSLISYCGPPAPIAFPSSHPGANESQAEGRRPPASKSSSLVQDLDVMEEYSRKPFQESDDEWILLDHE